MECHMHRQFWIEAWENGNRGFHLEEPNPHLCEYAPVVFGNDGRILVPLCGASHDLEYLLRCGYDAVGVELSPIAARELADRDNLAPVAPDRFEKPGVRLLLADFFETTLDQTGPITGIWDRAALVALHPDQREAYVAKQRELLRDGGALLLNTVTYDASRVDGPPWSVDTSTVQRLWPEATVISASEVSAGGRFAEAGIETVTVRLWQAHIGALS